MLLCIANGVFNNILNVCIFTFYIIPFQWMKIIYNWNKTIKHSSQIVFETGMLQQEVLFPLYWYTLHYLSNI